MLACGGSCGKNGPKLTILSFSKGLGLGCGLIPGPFFPHDPVVGLVSCVCVCVCVCVCML